MTFTFTDQDIAPSAFCNGFRHCKDRRYIRFCEECAECREDALGEIAQNTNSNDGASGGPAGG